MSLIEALVALASTTLLLGLGIPALRDLVVGSRVTSGVNRLVTDLAFARAESLKRASPVVLCESQDRASCTGRSNWSSGWLIYADANDDRDFDAGDTLLRVQAVEPASLFVAFSGSGYLGDRYLTYQPDGSAKSGSFFVCDRESGTEARAVIVLYTGRTRVSHQPSGGGQINCTAP
jgi:type IV fimbrial biogenesis protein FimT